MERGKIVETWIEYPSVKKMADRIMGPRRRGSLLTVNPYTWGIYYFCHGMGFDEPETALKCLLEGKKSLIREVDGFIDEKLNGGVAPKTIHTWLAGVKRWAELNNVDVSRWKEIEMPRAETVEEDRAPTREEVRNLMDLQNPRDRVITVISVSSGLRIGTLLGLRWTEVDLETYPDIGKLTVQRDVGRKFQGTKKFFVTFITPEAKRMLKQYRRELEEKNILRDRVFLSRQRDRLSVSTYRNKWNNVLNILNLGAKKRKVHELHVHTLRKFFRTQCEAAGVKRSFWEFWMGHKGGYLDESYFRAVEAEHVAEYRKAIPYLTATETPAISREEIRTEVIGALMGKISDAELAPIASKMGISPQMIRSMIRKIGVKGSEEETEALLETERDARNSGNNNNHESKLITEEELCSHIDEGWDLVKELSSGKILVKKLIP